MLIYIMNSLLTDKIIKSSHKNTYYYYNKILSYIICILYILTTNFFIIIKHLCLSNICMCRLFNNNSYYILNTTRDHN